ncbi:hypothetical protein NEOLEDRAFT_979452 [Neolentinus lepideus HHB14362 ss-1]|uniref:Uncharacterized protein n=1 Tax=Neolentinus lepideus HHB14362 ss-1 TaxID=1314782 RepID=A0A165N908_9AGAM|nr:hypothetical protein NEOLEDRAFT_979452 [Neolentinus lepideus HHB14362 ss-1]
MEATRNSKRAFLTHASAFAYLYGLPLSARYLFEDMRSFFHSIAIPRVEHLVREKGFSPNDLSPEELASLKARSEAMLNKALCAVSLPDVDTTDCNQWLTVEAKKHLFAILNMIDQAVEEEESGFDKPRPGVRPNALSQTRVAQDHVPDEDKDGPTLDSAEEGCD